MAEQFTKVEEMSFKQLMAELDSIVRALESNSLELEESLTLYERGVELLRTSRGRLDQAQQKVTALMGELEVDNDDSIDARLS